MAFPYNAQSELLTEQAILAGVADVSAGAGALRVSSITAAGSISLAGDAASNRVSAFQTDAASLRVSAIVDNGSVSAKSGDASNLRVSAIIDNGSVSAKQGDAANFRVSAILDSGSVSAKQGDAANLRTSAVQEGAAALNVSAKSNDGGLLRVSSIQDGAAALNVSAKSNDGALLRVSAIQDGGAALNVSAKSNDGGLFRTSSILDNGSVSAKSGDANQVHVSSVQGDASLLRVSTFDSVVTTNTGGASIFSTSAGIAQLSAIKQSSGRLYGWYLGNPAGVDQYLNIYDASATSAVTLGTTVPTASFYVPTLGGANVPAAGPGLTLVNGLTVAVVSVMGGTTAGASGMRLNLFYA